MSLINKEKQIISKILSSKEFQDSSLNKDLLEYLYLCTEKGTVPKESSIAIDVFKKNLGDETGKQSMVRVYIHNLRKKLDSYYRNEGLNDPIKISIPKGKYTIEFQKESIANFSSKLNWYILIICVSLFVGAFIFLFPKHNSNHYSTYSKSVIWKSFSSKEKPVQVIVGDYYLYSDSSKLNRECLVRDFMINNEQDFDRQVEFHPEVKGRINKTSHTFLTKLSPLGISKILPIILCNNTPYSVKLASNVNWEDLKGSNIIYIGSFKTLYKLKDEFNKLSFNYNVQESKIEIKPSELEVLRAFQTSPGIKPGIMKDYSVVAKFKGLNNNDILMFLSTHDIGGLSTIELLSNPKKLKEFEKNHFKNNQNGYFEALFEVEGYEKTDFSNHLLFFNKLTYSDQ